MQLALGPGHGHPLTRAHPDQVHLELGERGEVVDEQLPHRVVGVVDLTVERQRHPTLGQDVTDVSSVGNGLSKPVELRNDERVPLPVLDRGRRFAFGAADALLDVDAQVETPRA